MTADGLEAVFMANRAQIVRFLRARGAGDEAEDIAQDLWLKLSGSAGGPIGDPLNYVYRMADNLMIDRYRTATRRRRREESWASAIEAEPSIERVLASREQLGRVERERDDLGTRTAAIFRRFRLDGVGQKQIAGEEGISLSAVEKHLRKAYRMLTALRGDGDGDSAADAESPAEKRLEIGGSLDAGG